MEQDLLEWGPWILKVSSKFHRLILNSTVWKTTGASGVRLDAIKHMDHRFLLKFVRLQWCVGGGVADL